MDVGIPHPKRMGSWHTLLTSLTSFDEQDRLAERYVHFNIAALTRIAAQSVGRSHCVNIVKLTEGASNKIFVLTMNDGFEVIARIPTPMAIAPTYTTASEVATMDYLRNRLLLPLPEVYAWDCNRDKNNPVGAEYIIMEKIEGVSLLNRWMLLSTEELGQVIEQIVHFESILLAVKFPKYGSLYYTADLEKELQDCEFDGKFSVGPIATKVFWKNEESQNDEENKIVVDRGPCLFSIENQKSVELTS